MPPPPHPGIAHPARPGRRRLMLLPPLLLGLGGCQIEQTMGAAAGPVLVASGAALVLTGRTPVDHVASLATGRDCSVVRLERREGWCAPPPTPPAPAAYCTRSLGSADCWTTRPFNAGRQVADPPAP
ncbi:hypothetical protein [Falsiroseomonas sp.]|uniref:hypothetical protein n=1 Tax=Falsiroseomonas sp. TaxID=2870721 RepID=UPI00272A936D|nr:hypothetical protein [Falsiroseomonas sp.]